MPPTGSMATEARAVNAQKYGPDDTWPSHQKPFWNKALAEARRVGWTLTHVDAPHNFGVVSCPAGEHAFGVDKTAVGGETKSKEAMKKIRWCQHGMGQSGSKVRARQQECVQLLDVAEELIAAAAERLTIAEAKQGAQEDLDRLELQLQTAASNVREILLTEQEAALLAAIEVDHAPEPAVVSATLDDATVAVQRSESVAKALSVGRPKLAKPLLERAKEARTSIDGLNARLAALRERIRSGVG